MFDTVATLVAHYQEGGESVRVAVTLWDLLQIMAVLSVPAGAICTAIWWVARKVACIDMKINSLDERLDKIEQHTLKSSMKKA